MVDAVAERYPDALAVSCPDRRLSYAELVADSKAAAQSMWASGVRRGDRVAFLLPEVSAEHIALLLGTLRLGAVAVTLNARAKARELNFVLESAAPSILITASWFDALLEAASIPTGCPPVVLDRGEAYIARGHGIGQAEVEAAQEQIQSGDPARIIFTSGTTATPKGCLHSHSALVAQAQGVAERLRLSPTDRYWTPLPMFHTAGWTMLAPLSCGASFHHPGRFEAAGSLDQIVRERCTVLFPGFETIWMPVLAHPRFDPADLADVRLVINVGSPQRLRMMQDLLPHAPQVSNTGCTECSGWLAIASPEAAFEDRIGTCGQPLAGMEVRIIDPETGGETEPGVPGELLFRGPARLTGYIGDEDNRDTAIDPDGWFHTGDFMMRAPDGALIFLSRLKDMLKVGGENVAAAEIEDQLLLHPAVERAQVVAAPDARYGEVAAAFVERRDGMTVTEEELVSHCLGQIATFKVPRYVRFVTDWPMSGTKIKKATLRALISDELQSRGLAVAPPLPTP
jgi:fatty-acyl-CoA synthase